MGGVRRCVPTNRSCMVFNYIYIYNKFLLFFGTSHMYKSHNSKAKSYGLGLKVKHDSSVNVLREEKCQYCGNYLYAMDN